MVIAAHKSPASIYSWPAAEIVLFIVSIGSIPYARSVDKIIRLHLLLILVNYLIWFYKHNIFYTLVVCQFYLLKNSQKQRFFSLESQNSEKIYVGGQSIN
ncbi:hypothetical protein BpHYR1_041150 [Brachionus plicatilis]|uniref:Uncharacterized protein n=1 Tax=Brachionus plicatilis TaxID=10195 RepID=A0A3M7RT56_BRAPC|nr:hypothetical protein BpHYR1_041150 [Brachionus plicatilis]